MEHASTKKLPLIYTLLCCLTILVLGIVLWVCEKGELHLWMNGHHDGFLDFVMQYYTKVGEWIPYVVVFLLLFYKSGWSLVLLWNVVFTGLLSQRLKYIFDTDRPLTWFANNMPDVQLQLVDGVRMSQFYSCPSGHTITFVALFFTLSWLVASDRLRGDKAWQCLFFCLTLVGAYSRIYLSQHFAEDIWVGLIVSLIGCFLFVPAVYWLQKQKFWDWNLLRLCKKTDKKC